MLLRAVDTLLVAFTLPIQYHWFASVGSTPIDSVTINYILREALTLLQHEASLSTLVVLGSQDHHFNPEAAGAKIAYIAEFADGSRSRQASLYCFSQCRATFPELAIDVPIRLDSGQWTVDGRFWHSN